MCTPMQHMLPSAHLSLETQTASRSAQLTIDCRRICPGRSFALKTVTSHADLNPHLIRASLADPSPPKWHLDQFSGFCTAYVRVSSGMSEHALLPQNCPFQWQICTSSNTWFVGPPNSASETESQSVQLIKAHSPNDISIGSTFCSSQRSVPILYNGPPVLRPPPQNCPFQG